MLVQSSIQNFETDVCVYLIKMLSFYNNLFQECDSMHHFCTIAILNIVFVNYMFSYVFAGNASMSQLKPYTLPYRA